MKCPVCESDQLRETQSVCQQCGSNLRVHQFLGELKLHEETNQKKAEKFSSSSHRPSMALRSLPIIFQSTFAVGLLLILSTIAWNLQEWRKAPAPQVAVQEAPSQEKHFSDPTETVILKLVEILSVQTEDNRRLKEKIKELELQTVQLEKELSSLTRTLDKVEKKAAVARRNSTNAHQRIATNRSP